MSQKWKKKVKSYNEKCRQFLDEGEGEGSRFKILNATFGEYHIKSYIVMYSHT